MEGKGRLAGKAAIVTGGASGMCAATVQLFVQEGAFVLIADINDAKGKAIAAECGDRASYLRTDVTSESAVQALMAAAAEKFGRLDVLVAGAGIENPKSEMDTTTAEWDRVMDVNAKGVFFCSKYAIPLLREAKGGSIINISSAFAMVGSAGFAAYHASKGAVRSFTKSTAVAHASENIRANSIHPGGIDTPMLREIFDASPDPAAAEKHYIGLHPVGRLGKPQDIAFGALYLASDESRFVTGTELVIDGGYLAV